TISAFSSADHLRRRSAPVIISIRRTRTGADTSLVSSLWSTLWSKQCLLMGRHHVRGALRSGTWGTATAYGHRATRPVRRRSLATLGSASDAYIAEAGPEPRTPGYAHRIAARAPRPLLAP